MIDKFSKDYVRKEETRHFKRDFQTYLFEKYKRYCGVDGNPLPREEVNALVSLHQERASEVRDNFWKQWTKNRDILVRQNRNKLVRYFLNVLLYDTVQGVLEVSGHFTEKITYDFARTLVSVYGDDIVEKSFSDWVKTLSSQRLEKIAASDEDENPYR